MISYGAHICLCFLLLESAHGSFLPATVDLGNVNTLRTLAFDAGFTNQVCQNGVITTPCPAPPPSPDPCVDVRCFDPTPLFNALSPFANPASPNFVPGYTLIYSPSTSLRFCATQRSIADIIDTIGTNLLHLLTTDPSNAILTRADGLQAWFPEIYAHLACVMGTSPNICITSVCGAYSGDPNNLTASPPLPYSCNPIIDNAFLAYAGSHIAYASGEPGSLGQVIFTGPQFLLSNTAFTPSAVIRINFDTDAFPRNVTFGAMVANTYGIAAGNLGTCAVGATPCDFLNPIGLFQIPGFDCNLPPNADAACNQAVCNGAGRCGTPINIGAICAPANFGPEFTASPLGGFLGFELLADNCLLLQPRCEQRTISEGGVPANIAAYADATFIWATAIRNLTTAQLSQVALNLQQVAINDIPQAFHPTGSPFAASAPAACVLIAGAANLSPENSPCTISGSTPPLFPECVQSNTVGGCHNLFAGTADADGFLLVNSFSGRPDDLAFAHCNFVGLSQGTFCTTAGPFPSLTADVSCAAQECDGFGSCVWYAAELGTTCIERTAGANTSCVQWLCQSTGLCSSTFLPENTTCDDANPCSVSDTCDSAGICRGLSALGGAGVAACVVCFTDVDCQCTGFGSLEGYCKLNSAGTQGVCSQPALLAPYILPEDLPPLQPYEDAALAGLDWGDSAARARIIREGSVNSTLYRLSIARLCTISQHGTAPHCLRENRGVCHANGVCGAPEPTVTFVPFNASASADFTPDTPCTPTNCSLNVSTFTQWWFEPPGTPCWQLGQCFVGGPTTLTCQASATRPGALTCQLPDGTEFANIPPKSIGSACTLEINPDSGLNFFCIPADTPGVCSGVDGSCLPEVSFGQVCTFANSFLIGTTTTVPPLSPCVTIPACDQTTGQCVIVPRPLGSLCPDVCATANGTFTETDPTLVLTGTCNGMGVCVQGSLGLTCASTSCAEGVCSPNARIAPGTASPIATATLPTISALLPFSNTFINVGQGTVSAVAIAWSPLDAPPSGAGTCLNVPIELVNGASVPVICSAGSRCTSGDACDGAGHCVAGTNVTCPASTQCITVLGCSEATGRCITRQQNTTASCTVTAADLSVAVSAPLQCLVNGTCSTSGTCVGQVLNCSQFPVSNISAAQCGGFTGTCDAIVLVFPGNGSVSTQSNGVVVIVPDLATVASLESSNVTAGLLVPGLPGAVCVYTHAGAGATCFNSLFCTATAQCNGGVCVTTSLTQCQNGLGGPCTAPVGTCDTTVDGCVYPPLPAGSACNDMNPCTTNDTCDGGVTCVGAVMPCAAPFNECFRAVGTCAAGCTTVAAVNTSSSPVPCQCTGSGSSLVCAGFCTSTGKCLPAPAAGTTACSPACSNGMTCTLGICACPIGQMGTGCSGVTPFNFVQNLGNLVFNNILFLILLALLLAFVVYVIIVGLYLILTFGEWISHAFANGVFGSTPSE